MDPLRAHDLARARETPLEERARQALAAMREGIKLKRIALQLRFPTLSEEEIEEKLRRWLRRDA